MATEVETTEHDEAGETFTEAVLGKDVANESWARGLLSLSVTWRVVAVIGGLGALLFLPLLGSVGLWDPWETHYGEVARMMIQRNDYVYPFWEGAWFFSKPPMTMWLQALGMQLVGANVAEPGVRAWLPGLLILLVVAGLFAFVGWRKGRLSAGLKAAAVVTGFALLFTILAVRELGRVSTGGGMGLFTEWGMRLPFALLSITALVLLSVAVARVVNLRTGLATGFVLATMPLYFLLTRQTVTDTPFVTTLICAMACAMIGQLDATTRHRAAWWYGFYVFAGISTLAKGLLGVGLPAVILVLYAFLSVLPADARGWSNHLRWLTDKRYREECRAHDAELAPGRAPMMPTLFAQMYRMKLGTGILVYFAVAAPWFITLSLFDSVDDEGKVFWYRFFIHDHLNRLGAGVHTTTPYGNFTYFIEQGGYAIFPWVAAVPGALAVASRLRLRDASPANHLGMIAVVWTAFAFFLLGSSATKFHHYVFPILPGLAVLIALFVDRLWREGLGRHGVPVIFGVVLFALVGKDFVSKNAANLPGTKHFTDLFVYNYDRPYPAELASRALGYVAGRSITTGDLLTFVLLAVAAYLLVDAFSSSGKAPGARSLAVTTALVAVALLVTLVFRVKVPAMVAVGVAFFAAAAYVWRLDHSLKPGDRRQLSVLLLFLAAVFLLAGFRRSFDKDAIFKAMGETVTLTSALGFVFVLTAVAAVIGAIQRSRALVFGTVFAFALGFAVWFNWSHWVDLSHHWTQRDQFWRYYRDRQPGEPITSFLMNWRGETFYSRNTVMQIKDNGRLRSFADQPGREWALVEHNRLTILRNAVGAEKKVTVIEKDLNNKFVLVTIE